MLGKLWWVADTAEELQRWKAELEPKGARFLVEDVRADGARDVILELERDTSAQVLGYVPDAEEWLID